MDMPGNNTTTQHIEGSFSVLMCLLLIMAVVSVAVLVYLKNQRIELESINIKELIQAVSHSGSKDKAGTVISKFNYNPEEQTAFGIHAGYIIECNENSIKWLDSQGEEQLSKAVSLTNPLVKSAGDYLMVADIGGRDIFVIKGKDVRWSERLDNTIINAEINNKGYVSVVSEMKGYKGAVSIYDVYGNWIFTTVRAEQHILAARVSTANDMVIINTVDASGPGVNSNIEYVDMTGETVATVTRENAILPSVYCLNSKSVVAANDSSIICFDDRSKEKWNKEFKKVYSAAAFSGKYIVAAVVDMKGEDAFYEDKAAIKVIYARGQIDEVCRLDSKVINLETYGNVIAVNTGKEVHFINMGGKLISKYSSDVEIKSVRFFDGDKAAVITKNSVVVVKYDK